MIPSDTHPDAERVQVRLFRQASVAKRMQPVRATSSMVIRMAKEAIARQHPGWPPQRVGIEFIRLHYGQDLATRVAARLGVSL